jgi:hypothetical protein
MSRDEASLFAALLKKEPPARISPGRGLYRTSDLMEWAQLHGNTQKREQWSGYERGANTRVTIGVTAAAAPGIAIFGHVTADQPAPVCPHRHYKLTNDGEKVYIGPNFCSNAATAEGFSAFHYNVHLTDPGMNDIKSEPC